MPSGEVMVCGGIPGPVPEQVGFGWVWRAGLSGAVSPWAGWAGGKLMAAGLAGSGFPADRPSPPGLLILWGMAARSLRVKGNPEAPDKTRVFAWRANGYLGFCGRGGPVLAELAFVRGAQAAANERSSLLFLDCALAGSVSDGRPEGENWRFAGVGKAESCGWVEENPGRGVGRRVSGDVVRGGG